MASIWTDTSGARVQLKHVLYDLELIRIEEAAAALQHPLGIGALVLQIGAGIAALLLGQLLVRLAQQTRQRLALGRCQQLAVLRQATPISSRRLVSPE